jgi:putative ABC transport system permease protein
LLKSLALFILQLGSAFRELRNNKLRTFLSVLGISIGIFCIIGVFTMIDSFKQNIKTSLSTLGNDIIYVNKFPWMPEPGDKEYPWWKYQTRPQSKLNELKELKKSTPCVAFGSMFYNDNDEISYASNKTNTAVSAVNFEFNQLQNFDLNFGRYFSKREMDGSSNSIILGAGIQEELFGQVNPVGKWIKLYGRPFQVIGTLLSRGKDITGFNFENSVLISYKYLSSFKNPEDNSNEFSDNTMMLRVKKGFPMEDAICEIKGSLRSQRRISPSQKENFSLNILSSIQDGLDAIFITIDIAGFLIGMFSLIVGAFGIANIMFVTVKERTAQIGLKKALGASSNMIRTEFLIEAIILCLIGGLIGIGFVLLSAFIINLTTDFEIIFSLKNFILGISISAIVGVLSGFIPAKRASQLNPIDAIRS